MFFLFFFFIFVHYIFFFFFFQAEDGIRDGTVTGVQTLLFRSRLLADFEDRRRAGSGLGSYRTEEEIAGAGSIRSVLTTMPSVTMGRGQGLTDFVVLLPSPSAGGRG